MSNLIDEYINYIYIEKKLSNNTKDAYKRDLISFSNYLNNKEMTQYYKNFLRDRMKADNGYKYLGNSYLNGATPANNYTPSKPISITLRQDILPDKGNSVSEDIPYFEPTQTTPAIYRSFTDFAGSDSSRWICTYKHSKTGKWYIWDQSWHDLLTRIKQPAGNYEY